MIRSLFRQIGVVRRISWAFFLPLRIRFVSLGEKLTPPELTTSRKSSGRNRRTPIALLALTPLIQPSYRCRRRQNEGVPLVFSLEHLRELPAVTQLSDILFLMPARYKKELKKARASKSLPGCYCRFILSITAAA